MVSGEAGESLVIVSDGGIRVRHEQTISEAIRGAIAVLEDRRNNASLWKDRRTGKPIRLTSNRLKVFVRTEHIEDFERAYHGVFLLEDFLTLEEPRTLPEENRELIQRYFDETEDGFYKPSQHC